MCPALVPSSLRPDRRILRSRVVISLYDCRCYVSECSRIESLTSPWEREKLLRNGDRLGLVTTNYCSSRVA